MFSNPIFDAFIKQSPLSVLSQGLIARVLSPELLDQWYDETVESQYTNELLFSCVFDTMTEVVRGCKPSVHAAYTASRDKIGVSVTSLYNKLSGIEANTSAELVRHTARTVSPIIEQLAGKAPSLVPGYDVKIIDGNCLKSSEHRIKELRDYTGGALPGKSLVIYDPALRMPVDVIPCEDGHAQERALFNELVECVSQNELWVADRNFCTRNLLFSIDERKAFFAIRQHRIFPFSETGPEIKIGKTDTGEVFEQSMEIADDSGQILPLRRIRVHLKSQTRDGDKDIYIVSNLPPKQVDAVTIAKLYRSRWKIETSFQELEKYYNSEITTLGYPKAALFAFCIALVSYILMAVGKAALTCIHGQEKIDNEVSGYYIAHELSQMYPGMMVVLPQPEWKIFNQISDEELVDWIRNTSQGVDLLKYKKNPRGPKKVKPHIKHSKKNSHKATSKIIADRKKR